jgi:hypothetical protein
MRAVTVLLATEDVIPDGEPATRVASPRHRRSPRAV